MSETILSRGQRLLLRILVWGGLVLCADALFLLLFRVTESTTRYRLPTDTLPVFYQVMVAGHFWLGIVLTPVALVFAAWHLGRAWARRHKVAITTGVNLISSMLALMFTGFFILTAANSREHQGMFWAHMGLGGVMLVVYVVHRVTSVWAPSWPKVIKALGATAAAALLFTAIHCLTLPAANRIESGTVIDTVSKQENLLQPGKDAFVPFRGYGDVPRQSPFFPSAATTATGKFMESRVVTRGELPDVDQLHKEVAAYGFVKDTLIGAMTCVRCHGDIVEQWSHSAHRFSSMNNPFYRRAFLAMRKETPKAGTLDFKTRSQWCSGCHEPALMLAGEIGKDFDPDGPNAQAGLTCLSCHAIDQIHNNTGNGAYNINDDKETPYLFDQTSAGPLRFLGDLIIKAKPTVHKQRMLKPFFRTSEYCATCHKVSLDVAVNDYRWFRGQNDYDGWHDSGVAQNAARTFYRPADPVTHAPVSKRCADCHMPLEDAPLGDVSAKNGKVRSHRFLAVNSALPALRGDSDTIARMEKFLQDEKMRVDVFALRRLNADGSEKELVTALDTTQPLLAPGERVEVQVVVRNKGVGHTFPGGTNDSNEGYIDFTVNEDGKPLLHSGWIGPDKQLDPSAHRYGAVVIQHDGEESKRRNPSDFHVTLYANVIPPSTSDLVRYQFTVPDDPKVKSIEISADLKWRKFKQNYTDYVFEERPDKKIDLPITTIAGNKVTLRVAKSADEVKPTPPPVYARPELWIRPNDFGIGHLQRRDTRLAEKAFEEVIRIAPGRVDGYRNMARAYRLDGNIPAALEMLAKCETIAPGDPMTAYVWGNVLQIDGRYEEAEQAFQRVLQEFPGDRDTMRLLGRTYYLDQKFEPSLAMYLKVLAIDPEDREAHWHRVLNYQALGKTAEAAEARKAFEKYEIDESALDVTNAFRIKDKDANLETIAIHSHELAPLPAPSKPKSGGS
jgi:tetratricopeptide (TPR) repeat protein